MCLWETNKTGCYVFQNDYLVGGLEHFLVFTYIGNVIIPTDFHIFQRGRSTTPAMYYALERFVSGTCVPRHVFFRKADPLPDGQKYDPKQLIRG